MKKFFSIFILYENSIQIKRADYCVSLSNFFALKLDFWGVVLENINDSACSFKFIL